MKSLVFVVAATMVVMVSAYARYPRPHHELHQPYHRYDGPDKHEYEQQEIHVHYHGSTREDSHENSHEDSHENSHEDSHENSHGNSHEHHHDSHENSHEDSHEDSHEHHHDSHENSHEDSHEHHDSHENSHENSHEDSHEHHHGNSHENSHERHHGNSHEDSHEHHHDSHEDSHENPHGDSHERHHGNTHERSHKNHHGNSHENSHENHHGESHENSHESHHDSHHDDSHHDSHDSHHGDSHHDDSDEHHDEGHHSEGHHGDDSHHDCDDKVWRFAIENDGFAGYEYMDKDGYMRGFSIDLINAVCKHAGKRCHYIVDESKHCWTTAGSQEFPGVGLLGGFYDACFNRLPSPDRLNSFNFTIAHTPNIHFALHFREDDEAASSDITEKKLGFINGWVMSQRCLERQEDVTGNTRGSYEAVIYDTFLDLRTALTNGEIDSAVLAVAPLHLHENNLKMVEPTFKCSIRGMSVMAPYGSELIEWWNQALIEMRISGEYAKLCEEGENKHGDAGPLFCFE